jgi:hypothetical protein
MPPRKHVKTGGTPKACAKYLDAGLPTEAFCISGIGILFQTSDPALRRLVRKHWAPLQVPLSRLKTVQAVFQFSDGSLPTLPRLRKPQYFINEHVLVLSDRRRYLLTGYLYEHPWQFHCRPLPDWEPEFIYYYLFEPILLDVLKKLGVLVWHSAAVVRDGAAVLLAGVSGSGKSTTTLNFLNIGYSFLADDVVLLRRRGADVEAAGHESALFLTDESLRLLPEWKKLRRGRRFKKGRQWKSRIDLNGHRPEPGSAPAVVKLLLFPHVTKHGETRLEKLTRAEALLECFGQVPKEYPASILGPTVLQSVFEFYSGLVRSAPCYRIRLGADQQQTREVLSRLRIAS